MNKTIQTILTRVSCRSYSEKKVPASKINQILEAGKYAPSGMNRQICNILYIKNKKLLETIRAALQQKCGRECLYGAHHLALVIGKRNDPFLFQDGSCILENMFIAANALNVDSCWINQLEDLCVDPAYAKIKKKLGLAEDDYVIGSIILGYRKEGMDIPIKNRKDDFIKVI